MSDLGKPGAQLISIAAKITGGRQLIMFGPADGATWIIKYQERKRQHWSKVRTWEIVGYANAKLRYGVLLERLGRGLEVGDES